VIDEASLDLAALERGVSRLREQYKAASPFPHIVLDDFLDLDVMRDATSEFPSVDGEAWTNYLHVNERKYGNTHPETWGPTLQQVAAELTSARFVRFLSDLTGIAGLLADPTMDGGGLHQTFRDGYLNVHADFTSHHTHRNWRRRVNLLLYCNDDWHPDYGGELELWSTDMKRRVHSISPIGNRVVIFNTDVDSFHGVPEPLTCPPGVARQSMALYYFTEEAAPPVSRSTNYRARPGDGAKGALIYLDKKALRVYDLVKRRLGLSDEVASALLKKLRRR
jgi:hypothetical protein